jgi:hypothetical protein
MALRATPSERLRQWIGNTIIAWTLVASLAAVMGAAYYQKTGDVRILYGVMGAAAAGCVFLLLVAAVVGLVTGRRQRRESLRMPHEKHVPRQQVFMSRR